MVVAMGSIVPGLRRGCGDVRQALSSVAATR